MMILLITFGFDEKFALRAIFRRGLRAGDRVIAIVPERNDPRAEKAFSALKHVVGGAIPDASIEKMAVPSENFLKAVSHLRKLITELLHSGDKLVVNVSGGQRILILELLTALLNLGAYDVELEIETEDSSAMATFPLRVMMKIDLDQTDLKFLKILAQGPKGLNEVCLHSNMSKSSAWRRLKKLATLKLIEKRGRKYHITKLGYSKI